MNFPNSTRDRLHDRLVDEARGAGLLDLTYRTIDSPVGGLLLVKSGEELIRVAFGPETWDDILESLAADLSPRILESPKSLDDAATELDQYFEGERREFTVPHDLRLARGFQLEVLEHLETIRWGDTRSYSQVAAEVGNPRASRAVGTACAINPLPLIVPCHRVLKADGSPGNYGGGRDAKRLLLALEGRQ
jgi:methylated-DNA-[protein]-cysteine S-methyltransferase